MVVATGFFDGVHLGHREVIGQLVASAKARGEESAVITFWPHPRMVLRKDARGLRLLSSLTEKKEMLLSLGVDRVEVLDFTREFAALTMEAFLREYVMGLCSGTAVLLGYDNRMGSDCSSPEDLVAVASSLGLDVIKAPLVSSNAGYAVSSTKIRTALEVGDMEQAAAMLGYDYSLYGVVVAGNRLGRTLGFPTANMSLYEPLKLVPSDGVYLVRVETAGKQRYGMCNIGVKPTVGTTNSRTIETNIFDFDEEIYGLPIRLTFLRKIRDERRFADLRELSIQLALDKESCLSIIG
ncbi:MAG: riboflavin biosynthesis protein RibF [Bacteroidales bacterium]|nr:riboflavin biosynthesis protein RibF [Bacteroidales bacterium]